MADCPKLLREFVAKYQARIVQGLAVYGEFDPDTDTRNLSHEGVEEILDVGSYMEMLEQKHPELKTKCRKVMAKAVILFGMLRDLERDELELTRKERV